MKNLQVPPMFEPSDSFKSKLQFSACVLMALFGLYVFLLQMWDIHALWTSVGFVDTWPLYDRLMKFNTGQLSLDHYLLDPHVHPHSIVFFLYLMDTMYGSGRQLLPHFATLLSIIGLIATLWYVVWRSSADRFAFNLRSCAFLFGTLVLLSGLSEATVIPFQCVVVVTRFVYISLLAIMVFCQFRPNKVLHVAALAASVIAVSFFASGGVFAAQIVLLHLVFFRRWRWLLCSILPLVAYLLLIAHYTHPGAETHAMKGIITGANFTAIGDIALGAICYYASALVGGWPMQIGFGFGLSEITAFAIGFIVCVSTVTWAIYILLSLLLKVWRREMTLEANAAASCLLALVSLSVFASSLADSLLWMARAQIFGPAMGMPVHYAVLTSNRYAAFSSLAFMIFLFIAMTTKRRFAGVVLSLATFAIVGGVGLNSLNSQKMQNNTNYYRDQPEFAATALLMGMSPADPEASAVWPGVDKDWYWPTELPKTTAYLRSADISYAHGLPLLGQGRVSSWPTTMIAGYETQPVAEKPEVCRLNGNATEFDTKSLVAPQRVFPITVGSGEVVGYALHEGHLVKGHILCIEGNNKQLLFLSAQD
jgi:hypothetical protein